MTPLHRRLPRLALALTAALAGPAAAPAVVLSTSWTGAATGNWFDATWSNGVPNNGGSNEFAATINSPATVTVTLNNNATIDSLNLSATTSGTLSIPGHNLTVTNANSAGISIAAGNSIQLTGINGILFLGGNVTTSGGGSITLGSSGSFLQATAAGQVLTNGTTINGMGGVGQNGFQLVVVNQAAGVIDANVSGQTLTFNPTGASSNAGTLHASNGGTLLISSGGGGGGGFTNSGTVTAQNASTVNLNGVTITGGGGSFTTAGTGVILGTDVTLDGTATAVVNSGSFQTTNTIAKGTLTNNGTISFASNGFLGLGGALTLNGTGAVTLNNGSIQATVSSQVLTNGTTISGTGGVGEFGFSLVVANQGVIDASVSGQTLMFSPAGASSNAGTLRASNGGTLLIYGGGGFGFTNTGMVIAQNASTVNLSAVTVTGGAGNSFTTAGTGVILGTNNVTLDGTANAVVNSGSFQLTNTTAKGTLTNNGTISFASNGFLSLGGALTLNGSGALTLANNGSIQATVNGQVLTNGTTISGGSGNLGVSNAQLVVANQAGGLIDANISGQTLTVETVGSSTNAGTLRASNGGTLTVDTTSRGAGTLDNTGGTIRAEGGGTVSLLAATLSNLSGSTLTGGSYQAAGTGSVLKLANNANVTTLGNGTAVTLDGAGKITDQTGTTDAFRNLATINGGGSFQLLNGHNFTTVGALSNAGILEVGAATSLTVIGGSYTQSAGGTLKGGGTITANLAFNGGTVAPGDSPGTLAVTGNVTLGSGSTFQAEIGGTTQGSQYDFLNDTGTTTLGGVLQVLLVNGFVPSSGQTFTILADSGALGGTFSNVANGGTLVTQGGGGSFKVNYGPGSTFATNSVILSNFTPIPEPGALVLTAAAACGFAARRRRRRLMGHGVREARR